MIEFATTHPRSTIALLTVRAMKNRPCSASVDFPDTNSPAMARDVAAEYFPGLFCQSSR
jgi:hypothetical protein